jgi:F-type H+-transporting ATPase subunit delta
LSRVASRYSKALFAATLEQKKLDIVAGDLNSVSSIIDQNKDFKNLLYNPLIPANKKTDIIRKIFDGKINQLTYNFLKLLCSKKRSEFLPEIIDDFKMRILEYEGVLIGQIISSKPLSPVQVADIHKKITTQSGQKVQLSQEIDEDLIGGFIVKIKDTVIDLSVKNQLNKLRNKLVFG